MEVERGLVVREVMSTLIAIYFSLYILCALSLFFFQVGENQLSCANKVSLAEKRPERFYTQNHQRLKRSGGGVPLMQTIWNSKQIRVRN